MRLQAENLQAIANDLEGKFPGIGEALEKDSTEAPATAVPRATLVEILQGAGSVAAIVIAIKTITPSVNVLLQGIEPGKSSQEIMDQLQKTQGLPGPRPPDSP